MVHYLEVVKVIDLEPIQTGQNSLYYRLEIAQDSSTGKFSPNLWRRESYRIQPTFPQSQEKLLESPCDEEILIRDRVTINLDHIQADEVEVAIQMALRLIQEKFG